MTVHPPRDLACYITSADPCPGCGAMLWHPSGQPQAERWCNGCNYARGAPPPFALVLGISGLPLDFARALTRVDKLVASLLIGDVHSHRRNEFAAAWAAHRGVNYDHFSGCGPLLALSKVTHLVTFGESEEAGVLAAHGKPVRRLSP